MLQLWKAGGIKAVRRKLAARTTSKLYTEWIERNDSLSSKDIELIKQRIARLPSGPLISVVMPVFNTEPRWLEAAVGSVLGQFYPNWELCLVDDGSTRTDTIEALRRIANLDSRIRVSKLDSSGGISVASNHGVAMAKGDYIAFLDHDDELAPHALYLMVEELAAYPEAELIYSDEDKINTKGERFSPMFKPGWDPVLILSQNYICHLSLYRRQRILSVGGLRSVSDGAQDWDLVLRVSAVIHPAQIRHIPYVLYHWRVVPGSTAGGLGAKRDILRAQAFAVRQHLEWMGIDTAQAQEDTTMGQIRLVISPPTPLPTASIVVMVSELTDNLRGWFSRVFELTAYRPLEMIFVAAEGISEQRLGDWKEYGPSVRFVKTASKSLAEGLNAGARAAGGEVLVFLPPMAEPLDRSWATNLIGLATLPFAGAVGPRTYSSSNQSCGSAMYLGGPDTLTAILSGLERGDPGPLNRATTPQGCSALDYQGLTIRKSLFESVGGFDQSAFPNALFGVDLCLRITSERQSRGLMHLWAPQVGLILPHEREAVKRHGLKSKECAWLAERWGLRGGLDHYLNPNLEPGWGVKELYRDPTLVKRPWLPESLK